MVAEQEPIDISTMPELARLADEVRRTRRPRVLRRGNVDVAVLVPLTSAVRTPVPYNPALEAVLAKLPEDSVVRRTAGILHTDQPFPGYEIEREAAEMAMAIDVIDELEG